MKRLTMIPNALVTLFAAAAAMALLAGCKTDGGPNRLASHDTTIEYYRVFDIKTNATPQAVVQAASAGVNRNLNDAVISMPDGVQVLDQPGHVTMVDPASQPPGSATAAGPSCDGASSSAKAAPRVRGGDNMNVVACLFAYKSGYHLDMYTVFTKPEGGWLYWPRRLGGTLLGTPEHFTDDTMVDVVRAIREATNAQVTLVEAKPNLSGTPWLEPGKGQTATAPRAAPSTDQPSAP
jgi:outer membrane murein-binding lipoprotein Lpp